MAVRAGGLAGGGSVGINGVVSARRSNSDENRARRHNKTRSYQTAKWRGMTAASETQ